ncbi:MAG: hypothetical protein HXY20_05300 [Acidobacteria bacterium]|nr:hypothetical protein [Acidobacteriota bacterium]
MDGKRRVVPPRYKWALYFDEKPPADNVRVWNDVVHAGSMGVSNRRLER